MTAYFVTGPSLPYSLSDAESGDVALPVQTNPEAQEENLWTVTLDLENLTTAHLAASQLLQ
ncbi:MAG: hypothetical protein EA428_11420 [Spirochaetaceae bacterium]|nr:MAG: hypothetical protein EA428_11420 [Spirochaetaceae bacterium]